jgi:hypothetical protein
LPVPTKDRDRDLPAVGVDVNRRIASGESRMSPSFDPEPVGGLTYRALAPAMAANRPSAKRFFSVLIYLPNIQAVKLWSRNTYRDGQIAN